MWVEGEHNEAMPSSRKTNKQKQLFEQMVLKHLSDDIVKMADNDSLCKDEVLYQWQIFCQCKLSRPEVGNTKGGKRNFFFVLFCFPWHGFIPPSLTSVPQAGPQKFSIFFFLKDHLTLKKQKFKTKKNKNQNT